MTKLILTLALVATFAMPNAALALDSSFAALSQSGTHQFYVWCTGKDDYKASQKSSDAKKAQLALAKKAGNECWPVWQGLVN